MSLYPPNPHLRRSLVTPNHPLPHPSPMPKYRISKRTSSLHQQSLLSSPPPLTSSQILSLCSPTNYQLLTDLQVTNQNKKLKSLLKQLNGVLTYKVERKKVRYYQNNQQSVSMRELMEYVPKDFQQEERKNEEMIEELRKQLENQLKRKRMIEDVSYRNQLENEIEHVTRLTKQIEQSMRSIKRAYLLKQKQLYKLQRQNQGEQLFSLRRQLHRITKHVEQTQQRLQQIQIQDNKIYQKTLIISDKYEQLRGQYNHIINQNKQKEERLGKMIENNGVYLESLGRLQNGKRRFNLMEEGWKVKYYNALRKLEGQAERVQKVGTELKEMEYQVYVRKEMGERLGERVEEKEREKQREKEKREMRQKDGRRYFDDDNGGGFLITEIVGNAGRKTNKSRKSYSQHSELSKSGKIGEEYEDERDRSKYESLYD